MRGCNSPVLYTLLALCTILVGMSAGKSAPRPSVAVQRADVHRRRAGTSPDASRAASRAGLRRVSRQEIVPDAKGEDEEQVYRPLTFFGGGTKSFLFWAFVVYCILFALLSVSHRAQTFLIYLHWIKPPGILYPLNNLQRHRLASSARLISHGDLRGWHLLPPGPPFTDGTDDDFDAQLARPAQRVFIFFHGNSGTRACPSKRVDLVRLLAAHQQAHVVVFDYSGFGDSGGRPSEAQLNRDARHVFEWVTARAAADSDIVLYGQSLGTFAAVDLAAQLSDEAAWRSAEGRGVSAVVLDAPPASLVDAAMTHPVTLPFRILPRARILFRAVLRESLDSTNKVQRIRVPLLIMHGEDDMMITVEQGEKLYELAVAGGVRDVEFVRFAGCGHNNINGSPKFLRVLHAFLDKHLRVPCRPR